MTKNKKDHIQKLRTCSDDNFISSILITANKNQPIKLTLDFKVPDKSIYEKININCLKYPYILLQLHKDTSKHCNFIIICGESTGTYKTKTGFDGLTDNAAEFQNSMDYIIIGLENTFCFLEDIIIVSTGT